MTKSRGRISRREFINKSLAGATTLAGAPWMTASSSDSLADLGGGGTFHDTWVEVEKSV